MTIAAVLQLIDTTIASVIHDDSHVESTPLLQNLFSYFRMSQQTNSVLITIIKGLS